MSRFDGSKGPPEIQGMVSLKVDNLTYRTNIEDLEKYFKKYGEMGDVYIPRDRNTHESRGFAFVRFFEERDAEDAMDGMDGKIIDGREIRVAMARYGRPANQYDPRRQGRSGGGGSRSGGGGYRDRERGGDRDRDYRGGDRDRERRRSPAARRSRSPAARHSRRSRSRSRSPKFHKRSPSRSPRRRSVSPRARSRSRSYHD